MPKDQSAQLITVVSNGGQAVMAHTFNPSNQETEVNGSLLVQGQLRLDPV